jgi:hypothetical protein
MKKVGIAVALAALTGCASVNKQQYPNVTFIENGVIEEVQFDFSQPRDPEISLKSCVEKNVANPAIQTKDYSNRTLFMGYGSLGLLGLLIDPKEGEIKPEQLIVESSYSRVKAVGRIQYALDTLSPEAIRFFVIATDKSAGMSYAFTELYRIFPNVSEKNSHQLPEDLIGWQPWSVEKTKPARFALAYERLSKTARQVQRCMTVSSPAYGE